MCDARPVFILDVTMRALVLSGGGSKGAYQVGVLKKWMGVEGRDYQIMCGVSVGALNVSCLAQQPFGEPKRAVERLERLWIERVRTDAIWKRWCPFGKVSGIWKRSLVNSRPLIDFVHSELDVDAISGSGRIIRVGAVCLDTGETGYGTETSPDLVDWVLASASYPVFFIPIEINGKLWSDGGLRNITPLGQAIKLGATEVDVVICSNPGLSPDWHDSPKNALPDQLFRTLDIMSDQILRSDLQMAGLKNELAVINPKYRCVKIRVVQPSVRLTEDPLEFDPDRTRDMIAQGFLDADSFTIYQ